MKGIRTLKKSLLVLGLVAAIALVAFATLGGTATASDTGLKSPSANAVDTGGDGNGFELNPTYAYGDDTSYASNVNGAADRHRYYNYGISIPTESTINGIAVRLDWRLDSTSGTNSLGVELSWDGGTTWTAAKNNTTESTSMHTNTLGGSTDTWGHTWTAAQLGDANFRVRITSNSTSSSRDFYLDWAAVQVYYTSGSEPTPTPTPISVENTYKAQGSWAVSTGTATDGNGWTYHLWYPTNMTSGHPIISFGVGTGGTPTNYADTLDQLASWGFVVIANDNGTQGEGQYIVGGAQWMVAKNSDSGSIFYGKLDTSKIGAFGHSQGAGGVLNAVLLQPTLFDAAIANALPNPMWWSTPVPDLADWPTAVPLWIQCGTSDTLICSLAEMQNWYNDVPGAAARARLKNAGHNVIQETNNGYQGYDTAWFMYLLEGDTTARTAFVGSPPQISTNTAWQDWAGKNLP